MHILLPNNFTVHNINNLKVQYHSYNGTTIILYTHNNRLSPYSISFSRPPSFHFILLNTHDTNKEKSNSNGKSYGNE